MRIGTNCPTDSYELSNIEPTLALLKLRNKSLALVDPPSQLSLCYTCALSSRDQQLNQFSIKVRLKR